MPLPFLPSSKGVINFLPVHCPNGLLKAILITHFNHLGFPGFRARIAPAVHLQVLQILAKLPYQITYQDHRLNISLTVQRSLLLLFQNIAYLDNVNQTELSKMLLLKKAGNGVNKKRLIHMRIIHVYKPFKQINLEE